MPESIESRQRQAEPDKSEHMAKADVANGERPEQPESPEHATHQRERTGEHPVGDEQAETNRAEDSPS
jgi:hypothetical protein